MVKCVKCRKADATVSEREEYQPLSLCDTCYENCMEIRRAGAGNLTPAPDASQSFSMLDGTISTPSDVKHAATVDYVIASTQTWGHVHNELLFFCQNQLDAGTPLPDVAKYVLDFYNIGDCVAAKEMLVRLIAKQESFKEEARPEQFKTRIGQSRKSTTVNDILHLLMYRVFTDITPPVRFVAAWAQNLPSVSLSSIDATSLAKQVAVLRHELDDMKTSYVTRAELLEATSGVKASHTPAASDPVCSQQDHAQVCHDQPPSYAEKVSGHLLTAVTDGHGHREPSSANSQPTKHLQVGQKGPQGKKVQPRHKKKVVVGVASGESFCLRASRPRARLFVTRLDPTTTVDEIESHIKAVHSIEVTVEQLETKHPSYSSFIVSSFRDEQQCIMDANLWPVGALIRPYYMRSGPGDSTRVSHNTSAAGGEAKLKTLMEVLPDDAAVAATATPQLETSTTRNG